MSQPVTIAVRKGGGPCTDPPSAGYGQIAWEKTTTISPGTNGTNTSTEADMLTMSLQASPGKQVPVAPVYTTGYEIPTETFFSPACPVPGYRSLDAGAITVRGSGLGPTSASIAPLESPIRGAMIYQAALPIGSIQPGAFTVSASGGADVGAFQSTVQVGSGIQITTPIAGQQFLSENLYTIAWTGGDPDSLVTVYFLNHYGYEDYSYSAQARASDGSMLVRPFAFGGPDEEIVIEVTPDPSHITALSVPGLSLGGQHTWKYSYDFKGVTGN